MAWGRGATHLQFQPHQPGAWWRLFQDKVLPHSVNAQRAFLGQSPPEEADELSGEFDFARKEERLGAEQA